MFISRYDLQIRSNIVQRKHEKFFDYRGITHALTARSQGSSPPADMIESASKSGVDYLYITDLNDFDTTHDIFGYNNNVLVFTGKKISYLDSHFLIYSQNSLKKFDSLGTSQALISDFLNQVPTDIEDSPIVMAHPFKQDHEWTSTYPPGLDGIEVMNLRHMWQQSWLTKKASFIWSLFIYIFNPKIALVRLIDEPVRELKLWDELSGKRPTLGLLGSQSTGKIFSVGFASISFPTYEDSFKFGSNHIMMRSELTGVASRDKEKIHQALTNGNFYFSVDALANPQGFGAYMTTRGRDYLMGETISWSPDLMLTVNLPQLLTENFQIKLFRNGVEIAASRQKDTKWEIKEPGVYRVYARIRLQLPIPGDLRWVPWIYTNNFYVR